MCVYIYIYIYTHTFGFPGGTSVKNLPAKPGDVRGMGSVSQLGRLPGGGHGNPLQYSFLDNSLDTGAWQATVQSVTKSQTLLKQFSTQ